MFVKVSRSVGIKNLSIALAAILLMAMVAAGISIFRPPAYTVEKVIRGEIASDIEASGTIRASQTAELTWKTNGVVKTIHTNIGESVKANQVLAELDMASVEKTILLAESNRLLAERDLEKVTDPGLAISKAWNDYMTARHKSEDAKIYLEAITSKRSGSELLDDIDDEITSARDQVRLLEDIFRTYYEHLADTNPRKLEMVVKITQAKQNLSDLIGRYNWFNGQVDPEVEEMANADLNIAKADEEDKQRAYQNLRENGNIEAIASIQARIDAANSTINHARLISPIQGVVTSIDVRPGDTIIAGKISIRVDDLSSYKVDLYISEVDFPNIKIGQSVEMTSPVVNGKSFEGKVISIDQAGRRVDGVMAYKVEIGFNQIDEQLKPGMSVDLMIHLEKSTNALLVPTKAIRFLEGTRIIFVLRDNQPVPVAIRVGTITADLAQVVGGNISEGELIILDPPSVQELDPALVQ